MKICIGSDHTGIIHKKEIKSYLFKNMKFKIKDFGTNLNDPVDYPDIIHPVSKSINDKIYDLGIIICGSGNGAAITANKYKNVRAAIIWNLKSASLAKEHNNANIISIPARFIDKNLSLSLINVFINAFFKKGRHQIRIDKIKKILK